MDQAAYFNQMREKRKHEILTAARKMLLKDGTASFTMQKLAKKLDISTVTLYKYFKNMEDVMTAIADEIIPRTVALTLDENEKIIQSYSHISPLEQFLQLFHSFFYEILKHKVETNIEPLNVNPETLILVPLLHDLCKANFYKVDYRNAKNALGVWEKVPYYTIDDTIPYGHGEKSVMMITEYIKLTPEEKYSIRWHMGYTEPKELYNTIGAAYKKYPLALLMHEADLEATYFYDI